MRARVLYALCILLMFTFAACSNKSSDTAANSAAQNPSTSAPQDSTTSTNAGGNKAKSSPGARGQAESATPAPPPPIVIPAGKTLTVRLGEALGSKLSSPGQSFSATLAEPVVVEGTTVIPRGASAGGVVVDAKPLGRFKGGALLEVKLTSVRINGAEQRIETSAISRTEKGKGKRTAVLAGGGTALGALVGGLAGGGKGAAIGAVAGAGAGGAGAAFTGNKELVLPAESALSFTLKAPVTVNPAQ